MKYIVSMVLFLTAVSFAANYEFVFPEKIEYQLVAPTAKPELAKLANTINKKCPLETELQKKMTVEAKVAKTDPVKTDTAKKTPAKRDAMKEAFESFGMMLVSMQKSADSIKQGLNPFFNVPLEGVSVDDKYMIFALRYPDSVSEDSLYSFLVKLSMVGPLILEGGEATYGKKNNPFTEKNLQTIARNEVSIVLRAVARNGKYADVIVESKSFPIPYVEVPHKNVKKIKGVPAVEIGNQVWMAQNMNKKTPHSKCYENSEKNCNRYGRLYPIEDARKVCPAGWHLPSSKEFEELGKFVKESKALLSRNYDEWGRSMEGTDDFGFKARPSGMGYELTKFKGGYVPPKVVKKPKPGEFRFEFSTGSHVAYFWTSDVQPPANPDYYYVDVMEGYFVSLERGTLSVPFTNVIGSRLGQKVKGKWKEGSNPKKEKLWLSVRCVLND